jgi:flagellar biosynthesis protein FlhB
MEKTEEPTPRRLRRALERGDSPISSLAVRAASVGVVIALAPALAAATRARFKTALIAALAEPAKATPSSVVHDVVVLVAPALGVAAVAAVVVGFVQTGGMVALGNLTPKFDRLTPRGDPSRLFVGRRAMRAAVGLLAVLVGACVVVGFVEGHASALATALGRPEAALESAGALLRNVAWASFGVVAVVALGDVVASRAAWLERQRMTRRELLEERREASGDPEARRARRRAHEESLR